MDFDNKIPIYLQIIEKIKKEIILGNLKMGDKLPSVRSMADELRVNVNTIQRVYQELEREGITFTERGKGSFITENREMIHQIKNEMVSNLLKVFVEGMGEIGCSNKEIIKSLTAYIKED